MKFSASHEWVDLQGKIATIGISQEAVSLMGEIVYVDLPPLGKKIKKEELTCVLEASKAATDLYSPLSGTIVAVNEELKKTPSQINKSPEKKGWLYRLEISQKEEYDLLMEEKQYRSFAKG